MGPLEVSVHQVARHFTTHFIECRCAGSREIRSLLVKRYSYEERDYAFGLLIQTLRSTIGLSQAGLGERLRISRRAVAEWEGGLSYPKAERLKELISLGMQQHAFPAGREEQEIRALWKAAHQKVLLDEDWLRGLLAPLAPVPLAPGAGMLAASAFAESASFPRVNLVEA